MESPRTVPANGAPLVMPKDACYMCNKTVYPMDKLSADDKVFHKTCLKCGHCSRIISLGNYAAMNGVFYCKPHFKQLFAVKGNYTDGFANAEAKQGKSTSSPDTPPHYVAKSSSTNIVIFNHSG